VPPLVRTPIDEKLTVTGLPTTDFTCIGNVALLITVPPEESAEERDTPPPEPVTVTSILLLRLIPAIRARVSWLAISAVVCRS
jgi:hypothetical protein